MKLNHQPCNRRWPAASRREFLTRSGFGFGALAAADLLSREASADTPAIPKSAFRNPQSNNPLAPKPQDFPGKAKAVILLFMQGGPSHLETFDPKPELKRLDGQPLPASFKSDDLSLQFMKATDGKLMASPFPFKKCGQSGVEISELFPRLSKHADDLAIIRSCYHDSFIHGPALTLQQSGSLLLGHPSVGAWVTYGLGSVSDNLPAFMVMTDSVIRNGGSASYGSGFLPAIYQGTLVRAEGAPIQNLSVPPQITAAEQRRILDAVSALNRRHLASREDDSRLSARIANYELAFRMQTAAPELMDISREPAHVRKTYGLDAPQTAQFGKMCLLGRRMVERGVRFVQLYASDWDGHGECASNHKANSGKTDAPIAGLLADLKERGMLDSTLVVWLGEFGRTPVVQGNQGRDHSPYGFSSWMAGGGIRGGKVIGATDELGFRAVEDKVHPHDMQATMLSLLGLDHRKLTYLFEGRNRRLTDIGGDNDLAKRLTAG